MFCKLTWKNDRKTVAVISVREISKDEIPWDNGEPLIGRYDPEKGLLIMKPEKDVMI